MGQISDIAAHLRSGQSITPLEALRLYGCFRLAARIHDLRADGYVIHADNVILANGKTIAKYTLVSCPPSVLALHEEELNAAIDAARRDKP